MSFGNIKIFSLKKFMDISLREILTLLPLVFFVLFLGFYPNILSKFFKLNCSNFILQEYF